MTKFKSEELKTNFIPVCRDCVFLYWHKTGFVFKKKTGVACTAQGYRPTSAVYNSSECKKLFKTKGDLN